MENKTFIALIVSAMLSSAACDNGGSGSTEASAQKTPKAQDLVCHPQSSF